MINSLTSLNPLATQMTESKKTQETKGFEDALAQAVQNQDDKALKEACEEVETYMLTTLFKQMKASTKMGETLIEKGDYEETFEDFLVEEQCKQMVQVGGIGLADMMYKQMAAYNAAQNT